MNNPKRGEIWLVEFEPQVGSEIKKTRPAVVLSIEATNVQDARIVVPVRDVRPHHKYISFYYPIVPDGKNGLTKESTVDCLQVKSFDKKRFQKKLGKVSKEDVKELATLVAIAVGYF